MGKYSLSKRNTMKFILYILSISLVLCDGHGSNDVSVKNNCTIAQSQLMKESRTDALVEAAGYAIEGLFNLFVDESVENDKEKEQLALDWAYCNATCAAFNETCALRNDSTATHLTGLKL